ncbi:MAG TPA: hypothetical protein HA230_01020 [Candidatus Aenigmarchaeota archaeon]|nr:hypothetical protein [Candidatus Aenigmarchaeota archaeon]
MQKKGLTNDTLWLVLGLVFVVAIVLALSLIQAMGQNSANASIELVRNGDAISGAAIHQAPEIPWKLHEFNMITEKGYFSNKKLGVMV